MGSTIQTRDCARASAASAVSSDTQPACGTSLESRSRRKSLTAISPSLTGDRSFPLVQRLNGLSAVARASWPASRINASSDARKETRSAAGNGQALHAQCGCICGVTERQVVRRRQRAEHIEQVPGDGDFADRIGTFAIFYPEARGTAAVITGHHIDAHPDEFGDVETFLDVGDQTRRIKLARHQMQIGWSGRWNRGGSPLGMTGRTQRELARACAIEQPRMQHAVFNEDEASGCNTFAVERSRAQTASTQGIVNNGGALGKHLVSQLVAQEARSACNRGAVCGACKMRDDGTRNARFEHDRNLAGRDLAR